MTSTTKKLTGAIIGLAIVIPCILLMFIGPSSRGAPHDVPVGVAGSGPAVDQVSAALEQKEPGAFEVRAYADADALAAATSDRDVYGGFVLGPQRQTIIATGGSPVVATMLTEIGESLPGSTPTVVDVAQPAPEDPRGAGFGSMVMPVFMAGLALGIVAAFVGRRRRVMAVMLPVGAAAVGAAAIGAAMWVGVLAGGFLGQWVALSMGILAISTVVAGIVSLIGPPGIGLVAVLMMLIGMPLAGIASPPEFLSEPWATLGQSLPLGATGTALRSAAFFNPSGAVGAGGGTAIAVLAAWIVAGYGLMMIRSKRSADEGVPEAVEVEAADVREDPVYPSLRVSVKA